MKINFIYSDCTKLESLRPILKGPYRFLSLYVPVYVLRSKNWGVQTALRVGEDARLFDATRSMHDLPLLIYPT